MRFDYHSFFKGETNMRPANLSRTILVLAVLVCAVSTVAAQDWVDLSPGTTSERFMGVSFVDANTGWAAGWDYQNLYHTSDGGQSWVLQDPVVQYVSFYDIDFCDANNGMATGGEGAVIYTKDGGTTWEEAQYGYWLTYEACHMLNPDVGMAAGSNTINQPFVTGTVDSWANLVIMNFYFNMGGVFTEGSLQGVCMIDENIGFAAGRTWLSEGAICKTSDGSATPWETVVELPYACYGIDFPTSDVGYACCDYGNIWKTVDGGDTWNPLTTGVTARLYDIHFADENVGIAVGDAGTIISTTDGGATWTQENSGVSVTLNDVSCVDASTAFAAGDNGTIIGKEAVGPKPLSAADDFDRPDGTDMGPSWIEMEGNTIIENSMGKGNSGAWNLGWMYHSQFQCDYASSVQSVDFIANQGSENVRLMSGLDPNTWGCVSVKIQDNDMDGVFDRVFFESAINAGTWGDLGVPVWYDLANQSTEGTMTVYFTDNGDTAVCEIYDVASGQTETFTASGILSFTYPITGTNYGIGHYNFPYFDNWKVENTEPAPLMANVYQISARNGGSVDLYLDAGAANGNRHYFILGSFSGTEPGTSLPGGATLPLNYDILTDLTLIYTNTFTFSDFNRTLDADGLATAQFNVPGPVSQSSVGTTIHFAYFLYYPMDYVSNPMGVEIVP
jgi:photosystem II stability/assembly factor-like uncharacterized protein